MSDFEVTPADLRSLSGQISSLLGDLSEAAGRVAGGASASAQNVQLQGSIDAFVQDWGAEMQALQTKLDEVARRLAGAGESYEETEDAITMRARGR